MTRHGAVAGATAEITERLAHEFRDIDRWQVEATVHRLGTLLAPRVLPVEILAYSIEQNAREALSTLRASREQPGPRA